MLIDALEEQNTKYKTEIDVSFVCIIAIATAKQ